MSENKPSKDPRSERAEQQRNRILDAAERCFISHGFNAAGMALIAETCDMSPGLIYRYFENKSAIVLAIIERQLAVRRAELASLGSADDLSARMHGMFKLWREGSSKTMNPALFLEMSAGATRDPKIAEALGNADRIARADFCRWLAARVPEGLPQSDPAAIESRAVILQCFFEGLAIRSVVEPAIDEHLLYRSIDDILPKLLSFD